MLTALWDLSAAIRGYLRYYMPTNRAVDWLRSPRGLKWAIPVALVATPAPVQDSSLTRVLAEADCLILREPFAAKTAAGSPCVILKLPF